MKKIIIIILILAALGGIAYAVSRVNEPEKVAVDPCAVDFTTTLLQDVPRTMTDEEVARTILTQYLDGLKKLTTCPSVGISDYTITTVENIRQVQTDFMADVKFDVMPLDLAAFTLDTPETTTEGAWVKGKQATLGIIRADGTSTTTASYRLAI